MTVNRIDNDIKRRNLVLGGGLSFILWNSVRSNARKVRCMCKKGDSVRSIVFVRALWSRCAVRLERHPIDWNGVMGQNIPAHRFHSLPITNERESHAESHASCI
jgi:hypothetical protein